jgi:Na+/proline symporter
MGWVTKAMAEVLEVTLGVSGWQVAAVLFLITAGYSILSGLWGVVVTDFFQFIVAMAGAIVLAVLAVNHLGGLDRLVDLASTHYGSEATALGILPPLKGGWLPLSSLIVFLAVQWWASWYPGAEPGGGGYVAQRIMSTRDERHGLLATLWFNIAHYALRPWPWILVGLFAAVTYPDLTAPGTDPGRGYARAMVDLLPSPLRGLLLAAFAAAYMSTIATHLNWGTSYFVNDFWLRFVRKGATNREQVLVSRVATAVLMLLALVVMQFFESVVDGWRLLLGIGAGTGLVLILRWYWWRISAWSELVAMGASLVVSLVVWQWGGLAADDPLALVITVAATTIAWVAATFLTRPESSDTLDRFYRRVRPGGPGWRAVATRLGFAADRIPGGALSWVNWVAGWMAVYATLFGIGQLLLGTVPAALAFWAVAAGAFTLIARNLRGDAAFRAGTVDSAAPPP